MKLLMPVFVEMAFSLLNFVSMHNHENIVSYFLAITRSLSDEPKHSSMKIHGGQEILTLLVFCRIFVLFADLIRNLLLGMLQLLGSRIIFSLPGQLLGETVSEPDIEINDVIPV